MWLRVMLGGWMGMWLKEWLEEWLELSRLSPKGGSGLLFLNIFDRVNY
jgi:hypothetical protein